MDEIALVYRHRDGNELGSFGFKTEGNTNPKRSDGQYELGFDEKEAQDWKNHQTTELIIHAQWDAALAALSTYPRYDPEKSISTWKTWTGTSRQILIEACEHADCPKEIIFAIMDVGNFTNFTRKCLNPGGIGAMHAVPVCAERGSLEALKALVERGVRVSMHAVSLACIHGQAKVLDYLLSLSYQPYYGAKTTTLLSDCSPSYMTQFAKENGHWDVIKPVIDKYY